MTSFGRELLGGCGFSLILPKGLHAIISANPQLLLPTKSMVAYARKQSRSAIFEWQEKENGWYLYADEYPLGWEKKVKLVNLPMPVKKGSVSQIGKPKSTKRGDESSETCFDFIPYGGGLPIDTVFYPPSVCVPNPEQSKNVIFFPRGCENIQNDMAQPLRTPEHPTCLFKLK